MKIASMIALIAALSFTASADNVRSGKIVWDAGFAKSGGKFDSQITEIHMGFSPVSVSYTHLTLPTTPYV